MSRSRSRSRVPPTCISRTRSDALGKWKRRCHGCSDVRHDVQRTSLGGQIVETGTMCGLCGWNFEARPATTTGDWKTQANAAQHSGPPLFRLLTHLHNHNNNNNETRPTSSPPPLRTRHHFPPCDRRQISHILLHQPLRPVACSSRVELGETAAAAALPCLHHTTSKPPRTCPVLRSTCDGRPSLSAPSIPIHFLPRCRRRSGNDHFARPSALTRISSTSL